MILDPVLNPWLIALICLPLIALAVFCVIRPPGARGRILWAMRLVLVLACCVLLLRPGVPGGTSQTLATDTDVVLVVDTTASIVAEDWDDDSPRLDGVREDVQAIMDEYPGARFALITFDAAAEVRLPLTTDTTALASAMEVLRPEVTAQSHGSSIGIANTVLQETLQGAAESSPERSRMVFYLGDGEQTASTEPESFAASAEFTDGGAVLGYGTTEGGPMKDTSLGGAGGAYIQYQGGNALSVIDEQNLQTIADELGVPYQHRSADAVVELPEAPTTTTNYAESGEVGDVIELYWVAAALIGLLLAIELAVATARVAGLRGLSARTPRTSGEGGAR
ncbi:VWA domain-containing protein [Microbacterium sp. CIAB417]|uniref:vWA domain-containing protein n=1 Tax=Microbacterium sp. CIAB417 TaxID=2860287 RepID=UPI001FAC4D14|nr:VWA domain-containing protein [Microbacterium sp. CIAB417]